MNTSYAYFELPYNDLVSLLNSSPYLPELSQFKSDDDSIPAMHSINRTVSEVSWWEPSTLKEPLYATRAEQNAWQTDICFAKKSNELYSVYLYRLDD